MMTRRVSGNERSDERELFNREDRESGRVIAESFSNEW